MKKVLTNRFLLENSHTLKVYRETGGYSQLRRLFSTPPAAVVEEVKKSGLRGRGGTGFGTGLKWELAKGDEELPVYLCVNADESEPGTFKDRALLEKDPHQLIEGIIVCARAVGCHQAYVYMRGEFDLAYQRLQVAIAEAYANNILGRDILGFGHDLELTIHRGAGAYICGEETALLESIEGRRGNPRIKPPFPTTAGLFGASTVINNVETLSALPFIFNEGAMAYRQWGTEKSPGTKLFSVSGHVKKTGVYELPLGYSLKDLLEKDCGGISGTGRLKALHTGGTSVPVLTARQAMNARLDHESLQEAGTMLGSGGVIVMDDSVDMLWALRNLAQFYAHESCGQCTPCREGTGWIFKILDRLYREGGHEEDLVVLADVAQKMQGRTICALADALAAPVLSYLEKFREDFEKHIRGS